jgi:hippurate hydrolase
MKKNLKINLIALFAALILCSSITYSRSRISRSNNLVVPDIETVKQIAYKDSLRLQDIFKDLHQHPELGFNETRTSGIVANELKALGYKVITGIGKTGVVGILQNGEGSVVMYRADMDALPVKETTGLAYASSAVVNKEDGTQVPVMHACGHDTHVTWLLGVAKIMVTLKSHWKGTLVLVAQPAEELILGADAMVKDKMYERGVPLPDYVFAMHNKPFPVGTIKNCAGSLMAGSDQFDVTFHGIGGHGSTPHLTKDPVIMAATAILEYQSIVNRSISAQSPHVITVGSVVAGTANNIIPNTAVLKVNLRWFTESDRRLMIDGIQRVDSSIAMANNLPRGLYPEILMKGSAYPVVNDSGMVNKINTALGKSLHGLKIISSYPPEMGSEDFPLLIINSKKNFVYDYLSIGAADPILCAKAKMEGQEFPFYLHNSNYKVDLTAIPFGTVIGTAAMLELFRK